VPPPPEPTQPGEPTHPAHTTTVAGWTETALQAVRTARPGPPMAARSFAVMYTCMYNSWCAYDTVAKPTRPGAPERRPLADCNPNNRAIAMSYAAHAALVDQFPAQKASFDAYLRSLGYDPSVAPDPGTPAGLGVLVARTEIAFCHVDGANQLGDMTPSGVPYADYTGYVARNPALVVDAPTPRKLIPQPNYWQPLTYADAKGVLHTPVFLAAMWERVRPFALKAGSQFRPGPPAAFGSSEYLEQARHIVELQAALTNEQKVIAEYWNDGPGTDLPPGHWLRIGLYVSGRDQHNDDDDIKMFFALSNAMGDAAIAAWDAKRAYNSVRPITAVRYLFGGQKMVAYGTPGPAAGLHRIDGATWMPYQAEAFPTPPFPEYVSGHSTFSAAAAEVLRRFTGSDSFGGQYVKPAHSMAIEPGMPTADVALAWPSFSAAAEQAGFSRVYGGIHFVKGKTAGKALGQQVGTLVFAKAQALWEGSA
jgi:hypothetical protein